GADRLASLDHLDTGKAQSLLEEFLRLVRYRPGHHAADVVPVGDIRGPRDDLALREDRQRKDDVIQVRDAAVERIVVAKTSPAPISPGVLLSSMIRFTALSSVATNAGIPAPEAARFPSASVMHVPISRTS